MFRVSVLGALKRGMQVVDSHRSRCFELAVWPALLWLVFKSVPANLVQSMPGLRFVDPATLANGAVILFAVAWFRHVIRQGNRGQNSRSQSRTRAVRKAMFSPVSISLVLRFVLRSALIVVGASVLLVLPTLFFAMGWIFLSQPTVIDPEVVARSVGVGLPLAILVLSPLLVRLYAYYAAVIAGRHDVSPLDAWRWMRGKSMTFVLMLAGGLAPAILCLNVVEALGLGLPGYFLAMPVLFTCVALAAAASARAMADLVSPPLITSTRAV
ncbi:MAG: hypothetical protein D6763_06805 [Alphaproteobacteria bacterium]|nr:MAG: hypothetical protein D6763_06805 [Alphaproteobacteria bacterium]